MPAIVVLVIGLTVFALGYWFYGSYLARRVYAVDDRRPTPAHTMADGLDFVATNKQVLFGHHFTSVAGAAPIVGPAIAVFWGWGPAVLWVLLGTVFAAGVHDFGSLMVSVRHRAQNIGTLTKSIINARSRTLFLFIIFFLLTLVNAVFAVVIGNLLVSNPAAAIPVLVQIPLAIAIGQYVYRTRSTALVPTLVGVVVLYLLIPVGVALPISLDGVAGAMGMDPGTLWILLLFAYAFVASRLPVWVLLQPRDYINSHQLFIALGVIFLGMAVGFDRVVAPVVATDLPDDTPSFFPFLFVTIACGAISGFHSLVASGTTSKQLDKESDATYVGYAGAVGEGSLALGAILATTAGITAVGLDFGTQYADYQTASDGAVGNFVDGVAGFASNLGIPVGAGATFAAIVVISFAATTMDTGVRLQRYIIQELGELVPPRRGGGGRPVPPGHAEPHDRDGDGGGRPAGARAGTRGRRRRFRLRSALDAVRHHQPAHRGARARGDRGVGHPPRPQRRGPDRAAGVPAGDDDVGARGQPGRVRRRGRLDPRPPRRGDPGSGGVAGGRGRPRDPPGPARGATPHRRRSRECGRRRGRLGVRSAGPLNSPERSPEASPERSSWRRLRDRLRAAARAAAAFHDAVGRSRWGDERARAAREEQDRLLAGLLLRAYGLDDPAGWHTVELVPHLVEDLHRWHLHEGVDRMPGGICC